ncbi:hypothetical protein ANN_17866 [Periplaneta americana]|uniref:PiggyBac transposable element-derived protein domain-containing protein n=1 Tax=Periplaneta americana TaxID=6978 RepID=A0ABQ8SVC9_PERAM|nr:hypothetical protein ANN_17866 [Periplaneta americana]
MAGVKGDVIDPELEFGTLMNLLWSGLPERQTQWKWISGVKSEYDNPSVKEIELCENDTNSEIEISEDDDVNVQSQLTAANNSVDRNDISNASAKTRSHNIVTYLPGLKGGACDEQHDTPIEAWSLFIDEQLMISKLVHYTNIKITKLSYKFGATFVNHTDEKRNESVDRVANSVSSFQLGHEDVKSLWATDGIVRDIFRCTIPLKRFLFLINALRFDDYETREERKKNCDKLAEIRDRYNPSIVSSHCKLLLHSNIPNIDDDVEDDDDNGDDDDDDDDDRVGLPG